MPRFEPVKYSIKITQQCMIKGEVAEVGTIHTLPAGQAAHLIRLGRAEHATEEKKKAKK